MQTKILLQDSQIPKRWYNVAADMPHAGQKLEDYVCPEESWPISPG